MTYTVRSLPRAEFDAQSIYDWICERSADGGRSWWQALEETFARLRRNPGSYACAPEAGQGGADVRQILFKTRQGRFCRCSSLLLELKCGSCVSVDPASLRSPRTS